MEIWRTLAISEVYVTDVKLTAYNIVKKLAKVEIAFTGLLVIYELICDTKPYMIMFHYGVKCIGRDIGGICFINQM